MAPNNNMLAAFGALLAASSASAAALTFSHVYSDGMVLQRGPQASSVWGWAAPGATVKVSVASESAPDAVVAAAQAVARADGAWRVSLPPQPSSTAAVAITATDGTNSETLHDVLFGDVYVCSGQSNSEQTAFSSPVRAVMEGGG